MKPKTKLQQLVVKLSGTLPGISEKQQSWAFTHCFDDYAVRSRKTLFCLECGYSWKDPAVLVSDLCGCKCPHCGRELKMYNHYQRTFHDSAYYGILTTRAGFQIVRIFYVHKFMKKLLPVEYWADEVMQHWIDPDGNVTTIARKVMGLSHYFDQWVFDSDMEVKPSHYISTQRGQINPYKIYPNRRILPMIKRNGFSGHFYDYSPQGLFSLLLRDKFAETLVKTGQINVLNSYKNLPESIQDKWRSIRICIRKGYYIKEFSIWHDYVRLLKFFGKDILNPFYVCPVDLKKAHDEFVTKKRAYDRKKELEEMRKKIDDEQPQYAQDKGVFFGLRFNKDNILVKPLETVEEFMLEGEELKHCVFANEYYKKSGSLILSARINDKPIETIEISLENLSVVQCRGRHNQKTEFHDQILDIVKSNLHKISKRKKLIKNLNS